MIILIRGLPGSGKSTFARMLGLHIEADDYFLDAEGKYVFDPAGIPDAHAQCLAQAEGLMCFKDPDRVIVANTFSQRWEMQPYIEAANRFGRQLYVVDLFDGGLTDEQLVARNIHGVPLQAIQRMRARWEHDWKNGSLVRVKVGE